VRNPTGMHWLDDGPAVGWLVEGLAAGWLDEGPAAGWLDEGFAAGWLDEGLAAGWLDEGPAAGWLAARLARPILRRLVGVGPVAGTVVCFVFRVFYNHIQRLRLLTTPDMPDVSYCNIRTVTANY